MKRCLNCNSNYASLSTNCPNCDTSPMIVDGFTAYAPEYAHYGGGFNPSYFAELAQLEAGNFWFICRNNLIVWALKNYVPNFQSFFEIGCGTGFVLSNIASSFPNTSLYGSEIFTAGLEVASKRLVSAELMQMDARNIPFTDEFDVIGIFDVLEHIEEDELVLNQLYSALKANGLLLITVPQHRWLWSPVDEHACHVRRYSAVELHRKIESAGFKILRSTSFVTTLLPAMILSRLLPKRLSAEKDARAELAISPILNKLFFLILKTEILTIQKGINFPVGGSRLVVAKKL